MSEIYKWIYGFIIAVFMIAVFFAATLVASIENELFVLKGGVIYVLAKTSDSPEQYTASAER